MRSPATSSSATLGATASVDTPATSQYESDNPPDCLLAKQVRPISFNVNGPELKKSHLVRIHPRFLPRHILQSHLDVRSKRLFVRQRRDRRPPPNVRHRALPGVSRRSHSASRIRKRVVFPGLREGRPKTVGKRCDYRAGHVEFERRSRRGCGSARCVGGNHTPRCGRRCKVIQA